MEQLLTKAQINQIVAQANDNAELRIPGVMNLGLETSTILKMGFNTGVIIFQGNDDTGFMHIKSRHCFYSDKTYWNEEGKLNTPSKFSPKAIPIMDYTEIADAMYCESFHNLADNKSPDLFDLYVGVPAVAAAEGRKFKMVLYKDTKIVHTLYPTNAKHTSRKPSGFHFERGKIHMKGQLPKNIATVTIPYYGPNRQLRYTVTITYDFDKRLEFLQLTIHRVGKKDLKTERGPFPYEGEIPTPSQLWDAYQHAALKEIEQLIANTEKDKPTWEMIP
ncbi:hypothetical protein [[Flexibacter] sp. ATCC 35208]|uniref:hypothetical protein n=1 Tax=[Flexibacter] sp. ATCC 35208 TaxID=1936242 RepID=UPI0009C4FA14|nr:hypothetical protein [[Flexibacter] sp. ATCC 35208]OMP80109.1 hypothetical protein BW716_06345 [[Flexibacter] sp. ATCC 35208]